MIRSITLAALALVAGPVVATTNAQPPIARDLRDVRGHDHDRGRVRYEVLVRHRGHWDVKESFRDREDAYRYARFLERRGFDTRVERTGGR